MPSALEAFVLGTFVHDRNISAITDPILTKLLGPNLFGDLEFLDQHFAWPKFLDRTIFWTQNYDLRLRFWSLRTGAVFLGRIFFFLKKSFCPQFFSLFFSQKMCVCVCVSVRHKYLMSVSSQVFQVGFWCCKRQSWSTQGVDWDWLRCALPPHSVCQPCQWKWGSLSRTISWITFAKTPKKAISLA